MKHLNTFILESIEKQKVFVVLKPGFLELAGDIINIFNKKGMDCRADHNQTTFIK